MAEDTRQQNQGQNPQQQGQQNQQIKKSEDQQSQPGKTIPQKDEDMATPKS